MTLYVLEFGDNRMKQLVSRVFSGTTDRSSEIFMDLEKQEYGINILMSWAILLKQIIFEVKVSEK